jgi:hypothetical protein
MAAVGLGCATQPGSSFGNDDAHQPSVGLPSKVALDVFRPAGPLMPNGPRSGRRDQCNSTSRVVETMRQTNPDDCLLFGRMS